MKTILKTLNTLGILTLCTSPAWACPNAQNSNSSFNAQSLQTVASGCVVRITPEPTPSEGQRNRSYSFTAGGMFQIFNNVSSGRHGSGSGSRTTSTRTFFFFPRNQEPSFHLSSSGELSVRTASGNQVQFSNNTRRLSAIDGAEFSENPSITSARRGGIEIQSASQLILDVGYQVGGVAYNNRNQNSVFYNSHSQSCAVRNSEIFIYRGRDPRIKFATDSELHAFLSRRCPQLDLSSLLPQAPAPIAPVAPVPPLQPTVSQPIYNSHDIDSGIAFPQDASVPSDTYYSPDSSDGAGADDSGSQSTTQHSQYGVEQIGRSHDHDTDSMDASVGDSGLEQEFDATVEGR